MSLQLEWQYLQRNIPGIGTLVGPIEEALIEKFFPTLFGGEEINSHFRQILGHSVKYDRLGIPDPRLSEKSAYNTSPVDSKELVDSILGGSDLNYVGHRACIRRSSMVSKRENMHIALGELARRKEIAGGQERNRIHMATGNGAWLSTSALTARSCLGRNSGKIFASDMR